ncbi:AAA-ATPase [Streptomyces phage Bing]|uniref:AAA-ATPase n=1 Tax=Streptomyces phage Bing TaxID=2079427 RepID=A0A2L1IWE0_9CAUD|nr:DNA polymerase [Streptomyces phage Bing]AVD99482.1 AAA-ATPase [Streptomyces phage Bing]
MTNLPKAYNELVSLLLTEDDRVKFEWAIGAVFNGGPPNIVIIHGGAGSGKSTLLNIVRKVLMAPTRVNYAPRVVFQHDGYFETDQDTYVFAANNNPDNGFEPGAIHIFTTGDRVPVNKHYVLMEQINSEIAPVAEHCIDVYRNNDFQENNR